MVWEAEVKIDWMSLTRGKTLHHSLDAARTWALNEVDRIEAEGVHSLDHIAIHINSIGE